MCKDVEQQENNHIKGLKPKDWAVPGICSLLRIVSVLVIPVDYVLPRSWLATCTAGGM